MNRPTLEEAVKLVKETQAAAIAAHEMAKRQKTEKFGPKEIVELERLAYKAADLNAERKKVLAMFAPEEIEEMRKMAQNS